LHTFFRYYRLRRWTTDNPIFLGEIKNNRDEIGFPIDSRITCWSPEDNDKSACFPIITPAFPSMNSTFNVSLITRNVIITELEKGMEITKHIMEKKINNKITWNRLFKKFPFFKAYQHFIQI